MKIIGYQVENEYAENWKHTSFEVIQDPEEAETMRKEAQSTHPEQEWLCRVVESHDIENYSLI